MKYNVQRMSIMLLLQLVLVILASYVDNPLATDMMDFDDSDEKIYMYFVFFSEVLFKIIVLSLVYFIYLCLSK